MTVNIILGFPGVGKTRAKRALDEKNIPCLDSDISKFVCGDYPANYVEHIKTVMSENKVKVCFISSEREVRDALRQAGIKYTIVYPAVELKKEYVRRYTDRNDGEEFISIITDEWESRIEELKSDARRDRVISIELTENNETMLEVLKEIKII